MFGVHSTNSKSMKNNLPVNNMPEFTYYLILYTQLIIKTYHPLVLVGHKIQV